jgi:hypothetical protein
MVKSRRNRGVGHVARTGAKRIAYKIRVGHREGNRQPGRPRHKLWENIKLGLKEMEWQVKYFHLSPTRDHRRILMNTVTYFQFP